MTRKSDKFPVKSPYHKITEIGGNMEKIFQYIFYVISSLSMVFLPLSIAMPTILRHVPFYKHAMSAINRIFQLKEERQLVNDDNMKVTLKVGFIKRGETGFKELLESIKSNHSIEEDVREICLGFGEDILIAAAVFSPNYVLFINNSLRTPIIFNPVGSEDPSWIKSILVNYVKDRTQTVLAAYTAIAAVIWAGIAGWMIFGG